MMDFNFYTSGQWSDVKRMSHDERVPLRGWGDAYDHAVVMSKNLKRDIMFYPSNSVDPDDRDFVYYEDVQLTGWTTPKIKNV